MRRKEEKNKKKKEETPLFSFSYLIPSENTIFCFACGWMSERLAEELLVFPLVADERRSSFCHINSSHS
jgi:hypothetical protein